MPDTCIVYGTLYDASGDVKAGARFTLKKVVKGGLLVSTRSVDYFTNASGELVDHDGTTLGIPILRDSVAYIDAPAVGLNTRPGVGVALTIPDAATANLEDLVPATSTGIAGVSQATFNAHVATVLHHADVPDSYAGQAGKFVRVNAGATGLEFFNLDDLFATDAELAAALAGIDLSAYQLRSEENQNNGYLGLDASGLVPDIRIPASIARDTEVTAAVDAEAAARAAADTAEASARATADATLQTNITNEATARANADTTLAVSVTAVSDAVTALDTALDTEEAARIAGDAAKANADFSGYASKVTPVDADTSLINDSAAAGAVKRLTWANAKATLKTYFDTLYQTVLAFTGTGDVVRSASPVITTPSGIVKADVGLGNVDNTSDADKPVSTAQQTAIDTASTADRARANHTGTQLANTISNFAAAVLTQIENMLGVTVQAHDADLDAIAALNPSNDDVLQRKAGAWTNRTVAQVKSDLSISNFGVAGPTAARTYTFPDANATIARTDAAQTFTGNQTVSGNILAGTEATNTIGNSGSNRFIVYAYSLSVGTTSNGAGEARFNGTTSMVRMVSGFLQMGSACVLGWSSGDPTAAALDVALVRTAANGVSLTNGSTGGGFLELREMTMPAAPSADRARLFCRDNGAGKSQLVVRFPSGAEQVLATEP